MESSFNMFFKKKETTSSNNEEIFTAEGVYKTTAGNLAAYNYSFPISFFQGRPWIHLQDNRQDRQVPFMKEALEGIFRLKYQIEDSIGRVETAWKREVPPVPSLTPKKRIQEEEEDLPNLRIIAPRKLKVHLIDKEEEDL